MGIALIKLKIMPESLDIDLETIKQKGKIELEKAGGELTKYEEEPIAFGLKAIIAFTKIPEDKNTEIVENAYKNIKGVLSVTIIDYRRDLV